MFKVKKIMVAIDFSEPCVAAAQYAAGLASVVDAALVLTNVINQRDVDILSFAVKRVAAFSIEKHIEEQIENRKKLFADLQKKLNLDDAKVQTSSARVFRIGKF